MAVYHPLLDSKKLNEGRIHIKDLGIVNEYGNIFVSPNNFKSLVPQVDGTDIDNIILTNNEVKKFIGLKFKI
jgi:hypothetical protein